MTSPPAGPVLADRLREFLHHDQARRNLEAYFAEPASPDRGYAGRNFERLAGGGDRSDRAHRITAEDLVAVQTLSVTVPPETSVQLLEGDLGLQVNQYLRDIPTGISLLDPHAATHLTDGAPADGCWHLLMGDAAPGIGATTAGKLLARKRPHLIPIYDDVVRCALGHPTNFWTSLHQTLVEHADLAAALDTLRAQVPHHASHLRVLDVVVWMSHEREHRTGCKAGLDARWARDAGTGA